MQLVTNPNKKANFSARCAVTGLFLSGVTEKLECISITNTQDRAYLLNSFDDALDACKLLRASYGSFDWRPVEVA